MTSMIEDLEKRIIAAMRARDSDVLLALRLIKSEIKKEQIDLNVELDEAAIGRVLGRMAKQRRDSIEQFTEGGRRDLADKEAAELKIIEQFLPEALTPEQIDEIINQTLERVGEVDPKKMGVVIGQVMGALKATGKSFDGKAVNKLVRERLEG